MEYKLIFSELGDPESLNVLVNLAIAEGWLPNGSPCPYGADNAQLVQSLIRKKDHATIFNSIKKGNTAKS